MSFEENDRSMSLQEAHPLLTQELQKVIGDSSAVEYLATAEAIGYTTLKDWASARILPLAIACSSLSLAGGLDCCADVAAKAGNCCILATSPKL